MIYAWRDREGIWVLPLRRNLATECRGHRPMLSVTELTPAAPAPPTRRAIEPLPAVAPPAELAPAPRQVPPGALAPSATPDLAALVDRARPLMPMGRGELAKALDVKPHWARRVIETLNAEQPELRLVAREDKT